MGEASWERLSFLGRGGGLGRSVGRDDGGLVSEPSSSSDPYSLISVLESLAESSNSTMEFDSFKLTFNYCFPEVLGEEKINCQILL